MKKNILRTLIIAILIIPANTLLARQTTGNQKPAAAPVFNSVIQNADTIPSFNKFELLIGLSATYTNPYDYEDIRVQCIFNAPSGRRDTVDGFFMQDYILNMNGSLTTSGSGSFRVRYTPGETGNFSYQLSCTNGDGNTTYPLQSFQCIKSADPGFIRKNNSNYLSFDNGMQFIPVGENMGWQNNNVINDYTTWLGKLSSNGGNFIRVWMASWAFGLEWKSGYNGFTGLKNYKQTNAFYFDWLIDYCHQKKIYIMATLNNHGQVSTTVNPEWADNPYNAVNNGPVTNTWDFFTNATAKNLHKNRLRYIIARYGYAQAIQSWELFNEIDWTDQFDARKTDVKNWHQEMADFIKSKDVYKHLVSTSFAKDVNDDATWNIPNIDFTQTHYYIGAPNIEKPMAAGTQNYLAKFQKPTLNGEFGLGPSGSTLLADDPTGIHIHNAIWGSQFGGAMGSGLSWWWDDYIQPGNLYYHFKPLAAVVNDIQFVNDNYKKTGATLTGGGVSDASFIPAADWGLAPSSSFTVDATGTLTPGEAGLCKYLYGSLWNTQFRNPPAFNVNFPAAGQFKVVTGGSTGAAPQLNIYLDGTLQLNTNATINSTYYINVTAGTHTIKVDNPGTDWILISNYIFTNLSSPLTVYSLKSADGNKVAGYILNNLYNWQYLKNSGGMAPAAVSGAGLQISGLQDGNCIVQYYSCSTGLLLSSTGSSVISGILNLPLPVIGWDVSFRVMVNTYIFSGNGNWSNPANWSNGILPPSTLPTGSEIIINPLMGGECFLDIMQTVSAGAKLSVYPNTKFKVGGNLVID